MEIQTRAERHRGKAVAVFQGSKWMVFVHGIASTACEPLVGFFVEGRNQLLPSQNDSSRGDAAAEREFT
jgi:hypothetical protein